MKTCVRGVTVLLGLVAGAESGLARDIYLRPNETRNIRGVDVTCMAKNPGGGQIARRTFQCTAAIPSYPSLTNKLLVRTETQSGDVNSGTLVHIHYQRDCQTLAAELTRKCASGPSCNVFFCEADNAFYPSLAATLYQVKSESNGRLQVNTVQKYGYMSECKQGLP